MKSLISQSGTSMCKKVWPCSECHDEDKEVFDVNGRDFCGDCLVIRAKVLESMLEDMGRYQFWRLNRSK